jgi:hypothetical protein
MPDSADKKRGKFRKGKSGNSFGRPKGVRNKAILLAEKLLENETEVDFSITHFHHKDIVQIIMEEPYQMLKTSFSYSSP